MEKTLDPKEVEKRLVGKTKEEQAEEITRMVGELGVKVETPEERAAVHFTDEQFRQIMDKMVDASSSEAQKAIKEIAGKTERKYGISAGEAAGIAHEQFGNLYQKHRSFQDDCKMAAEVLNAVAMTSQGRARAGQLHEAYEKEADYLIKTGRESRAMSLTTDSSGGYLGGEIFSTMLYDNIARVSNARKYATIVEMEREILRVPKLTATFTAEQTSEASEITVSQPTLDQFVLNTKKINVLSKPFSVELLETADPALIPTLVKFATIELAKKEDSLVFSTSAPGVLSHTTNKVTLASGSTAITDVTFDDLHDLVNELDEQYIPDEDISGSDIITGEARFWVPRTLINVLAKAKGNDNYHWTNVQELKLNKRVHGFDMKRVVSMSQSPSAGDNIACFGNLKYMWCGVRPGFRIEFMNQGTVDSVNLNTTNSYALRVTEFFDNDSIDDEAFSILELAAS